MRFRRYTVQEAPTWLLLLVDIPVHRAPKGASRWAHEFDLVYEICLELEFRDFLKGNWSEG